MYKFRTPEQMLESSLIVSHYSGSLAYGTNLPTSDIDIRGIYVADSDYIRNPWLNTGEITLPKDDTKFYELNKFVKLIVDQNPNIVESLWVDNKSIIETSDAYEYLRSQRDHLLSSKMMHTFCGYAFSQLKRIKGHNKWLNNPQPEQPPMQIDHISLIQDFSDRKVFKITRELLAECQNTHKLVPYGNNIFGMIPSPGGKLYNPSTGSLNIADTDNRLDLPMPTRIVKFNIDQYKEAKENHSNYWEWKENRNKTRSALEEQFGYDTKHAMHLIRLLTMCNETLETGQVHVLRPDAADLLEIRAGKYTYDQLIDVAETLENNARELYKTTPLRKSVDLKKAATILFETQELVWSNN
jgi:predicted nucleotidyltransferase